MKNQIQLERIKNKQMKELDKMKVNFFNYISHGLKTPITLILGPLQQIINKEKKSAIVQEKGKVAMRNLHYLLRLVNEILDLSKVDSKMMQIKVSRSQLFLMIKELADNFIPIAENRNIRYSIDVADIDSFHWFDYEFLEKIINP